MAKPTYYPDWATSTVNLPGTGKTNKVRPREVIRTVGWDKGQIPTAEELNWWFNSLGVWIRYFDQEFIPTISQTYLPKNGTKINFSGDLSGTASFVGNSTITASITVLDNSHKHVSNDISDATPLPTPNMIMRRDANATVMAGDIISCATAPTDAATYFFRDYSGKTIGNISSGQTDTGELTISRITPSNQAVPSVIRLTSSAGVQMTQPRSLSGQETVGPALVRYDYLNTRLTGLQNSLESNISSLQTAYVRDVRLGPQYNKVVPSGGTAMANSGGVMVGWSTEGSNPGGDTVHFRPVQKNINGSWITVGQV